MSDSSSRSQEARDVFGRLQPPAPPPELRQRVLVAARRAATGPAHRPAWWWPVPRFDLAWAAALLLLLLGNLALPPGDRAQPRPKTPLVASREQRLLERELGMRVGLLAAPAAPDRTRARERLRLLLETGGEGRS